MSSNKEVSKHASNQASNPMSRPESDATRHRVVQPAVDVFEDASGITVLADMPGVRREQLELKIENDSLLIEGEVQALTPEGMEAIYAEVRVPRYRRSFALSRELDTARIEATLKDGLLSVRIPKLEHAQPRRIEISVA